MARNHRMKWHTSGVGDEPVVRHSSKKFPGQVAPELKYHPSTGMASPLLRTFGDERMNPEAASLLCVAFSRARRTIVVIADVATLPSGGVDRRALTAARKSAAA